jgi:hypothetical protein
MEATIFEGIDVEFFDIRDKQPDNGEHVIIVLKTGVASYTRPRTTQSTWMGPHMVGVVAKRFKTVPTKFVVRESYYSDTFMENQIICWGRTKKD